MVPHRTVPSVKEDKYGSSLTNEKNEMTAEKIILDKRDPVGVVILNRPNRQNAVDAAPSSQSLSDFCLRTRTEATQ